MIENGIDNEAHAGVPICLAEDVAVNRDIAKDEKIFMSDIVYDANRFDFALYSQAAKGDETVTYEVREYRRSSGAREKLKAPR